MCHGYCVFSSHNSLSGSEMDIVQSTRIQSLLPLTSGALNPVQFNSTCPLTYWLHIALCCQLKNKAPNQSPDTHLTPLLHTAENHKWAANQSTFSPKTLDIYCIDQAFTITTTHTQDNTQKSVSLTQYKHWSNSFPGSQKNKAWWHY